MEKSLFEPVLQLDALHLGASVAEHAEADGDVGRIVGEVGDAPRDDGEAGGHVGHAGVLLSRSFVSRSIALVKQ